MEYDARAHALLASQYLESVGATDRRIQDADPAERGTWAASGELARMAAEKEWATHLAMAHALTAVALALTDGRATS